jgi:hypothetical protein
MPTSLSKLGYCQDQVFKETVDTRDRILRTGPEHSRTHEHSNLICTAPTARPSTHIPRMDAGKDGDGDQGWGLGI